MNPRLAGSALATLLLATGCVGSKWYRPSQEFRTTSAATYTVGVQKNGLFDVNLMSRAKVFDDAYPMVWLEGENAPRRLELDGRISMRQPLSDALGQGQGMIFKKGNAELQISIYPSQPFFTVRAGFVNTGREPVRVRAIMPWCADGLTLGNGTVNAVLLENGRAFDGDPAPRRSAEKALSDWNLAAVNPANGRSLIAGFLTHDRARTRIRLERGPKADADTFDIFRAECLFDPPVEVPPGGVLASERLYVAVSESDALDGLERYGHAMAVENGVRRGKPFLPHGWDSWNTRLHTDVNEENMLAALEFIDRNLKRYGWTHFAIDDGWQRMRGDWEAHPEKFPHGMKWFADQVHARGMTFGLWIDAFRVDVDSPVAQAHPEWLRGAIPAAAGMLDEDQRIVDITTPGAYEHVRDVFARMRGWGVDALMEADFVYLLLLADSYHDSKATRIEVFRRGMQAIREGFGDDRLLVSMPPLPVTGLYADVMRIGNDCAPIWRRQPGQWPWGCVEAMTNAARRFYFSPYMWAADPDCAYFGHPGTRERWNVANAPALTPDQSIAWLTAATLCGGTVLIGDNFPDLAPAEVDTLQRLLPNAGRPARPVDLFESEHPRIWSLPVRTDAGQWHIFGLFNWNENAEETISVDLRRAGLSPRTFYTVYNFWADTYHGTVRDRLDIRLPAGSVQLLGLRPYEDRPMFLAHDRHFAQGALDVTALRWDADDRLLSGTLEAVEDTDYGLRILVPPRYAAQSAMSTVGLPRMELQGRLLRLQLRAPRTGPIAWEIRF